MIAVPVTSAECERTFSKLALIKNKLRTSCGQERLEKLLFCSVERDIVQQIDTGHFIDRFDGDNRRLALKWPCHFMGNQVSKFVIFLYVYIPVMYMPAFVNMFVVPPPMGENPGDATALHLTLILTLTLTLLLNSTQ